MEMAESVAALIISGLAIALCVVAEVRAARFYRRQSALRETMQRTHGG
jgi:hypothetical protein